MKPTKMQPVRAPSPGIYQGVDEYEYHRWSAYNWSTLKLMTPGHIRAYLDSDPPPPKGAQEFGSLVHQIILEPDRFDPDRVVEISRVYDKSRRGRAFSFDSDSDAWGWAIREEQLLADEEKRPPRQVLPSGGLDALKTACRPFFRNPVSREIIEETPRQDREISMVWECPHTGLLMKARIDILKSAEVASKHVPGRCLGDIKTSRRPTPFGFARDVFFYDYHAQVAHYAEGWRVLEGERLGAFFVVLHKDAVLPEVQVRPMSYEYMEMGRVARECAVERLADAISEGVWPGRDHVEELLPPGQAISMFTAGEEAGGV